MRAGKIADVHTPLNLTGLGAFSLVTAAFVREIKTQMVDFRLPG